MQRAGHPKRRLLWLPFLLLLLAVGYTTGYVLMPPERASVSRTLPQSVPELPQPSLPTEIVDDV